jgi:transglutaminase-like putative cysteine protease
MRRRRCLALPLAWAAVGIAPAAQEAAQEAGLVQRRLRFSLTFANPFTRPLGRQVYYGYLPAALGQCQQPAATDVSAPYRIEQDSLGHRVLALAFDELPPLAQKVVGVTVGVTIDSRAPASLREPPATWLGAERWIESTAAPIVALAATLRRADDAQTARAVYDWVAANLEYAGYLPDDLGALRALEGRRGDCTEYATLAVALCRANGIPARMMGGYVCDRDAAPRAADYHNWAEVCLDGAWYLLDAQKRRFLAAPEQYIVFRIYRDRATNAVGLAHRYRVDGQMVVAL